MTAVRKFYHIRPTPTIKKVGNLGEARDRAAEVLHELRAGKISTEVAVEKLKDESRRGRTWVDLVIDL
jgi:hypothetical protein